MNLSDSQSETLLCLVRSGIIIEYRQDMSWETAFIVQINKETILSHGENPYNPLLSLSSPLLSITLLHNSISLRL